MRVARRLQMDVPQPKPRYTFRPPALAVRPRGAHCSSLKHAPIHLWAHLKRELRREDEGEGEQVLDEWGHTTAAGQRGVECARLQVVADARQRAVAVDGHVQDLRRRVRIQA